MCEWVALTQSHVGWQSTRRRQAYIVDLTALAGEVPHFIGVGAMVGGVGDGVGDGVGEVVGVGVGDGVGGVGAGVGAGVGEGVGAEQ